MMQRVFKKKSCLRHYGITYKNKIGETPFELAFGVEAVILVEVGLLSF